MEQASFRILQCAENVKVKLPKYGNDKFQMLNGQIKAYLINALRYPA